MPVYPTPSDATYDYLPITGGEVDVGVDVLAVLQTEGPVNLIVPGSGPTPWLYVLTTPLPDGTSGVGVAFFPDDWSTLPSYWWGRLRLWKRAAKLADAATFTADDGSEWIYDAGSVDGRMACYLAGSTFTRGQRLSRGEITTDARDLYTADDAEWDWLPVQDATTVSVGDYVLFGYAQTGVVATVDVYDGAPYYTRRNFERADSDTLGWADTVYQDGVSGLTGTWQWFRRSAKPSGGDLFAAADGSRWIYTAGDYWCWSPGGRYPVGAVVIRGDIVGGLTPIP